MNTLVKLGVAGAMALGFTTANAAFLQPSSGTGDLILFVQDTAATGTYAGDTFAVDLSTSINSVFTPSLPQGSAASNFNPTPYVLNGSGFSLSSINGLSSFLSDTGTDPLQWAVEAAQYPTNSNNPTNEPTGNTKYVTTLGNGVSVAGVAGITVTKLDSWGTTMNTTVNNLNANATTNGTLASGYTFGKAGSGTSGVWNTTDTGGTIYNWAGFGPSTLGVATGTASELYGLTGNGGTGQAQVYDLGSLALNITSASNYALVFTANGAPVPLPAAVWLFGSGLLGLAGVGRRRTSNA